MNEQLISFETAKLAEEKGFDFSGIEYRDTKDNSVVTNVEERLNYFETSEEAEMIQLPTQSLLQKWLREKHRLWCGVTPLKIDKYCYWYHGSGYTCTEKQYDTWEEALEQALLTLLRKIKL